MASEDHSDADCFVCAILSHGEEGEVYGTNGTMKLDNIFKMFKGDACPSLVGKPKLFFIQVGAGWCITVISLLEVPRQINARFSSYTP